jgi:hypothetical protein
MTTRRNIVCICGSGRFWNEILQAAADLTLKGHVVLQPNFVVNPGGYIGESTGNEIRHATRTGKRITFLDGPAGDAWVQAHVVAGEKSGPAVLLPDPEVVTLRRAAARFHNERIRLLQDVCGLLDHLEAAWGVIANAPGGAWHAEDTAGWRGVAEKWRDRWHEILRSPIMEKTKKLRAERHLQERISRTVDAAKAGRMNEVQGELAAIADLLRQAWSDSKEIGA